MTKIVGSSKLGMILNSFTDEIEVVYKEGTMLLTERGNKYSE